QTKTHWTGSPTSYIARRQHALTFLSQSMESKFGRIDDRTVPSPSSPSPSSRSSSYSSDDQARR
ncbi:hypothetical protein CISIN_1g0467711mg, partial [Citrus sinensis]